MKSGGVVGWLGWPRGRGGRGVLLGGCVKGKGQNRWRKNGVVQAMVVCVEGRMVVVCPKKVGRTREGRMYVEGGSVGRRSMWAWEGGRYRWHRLGRPLHGMHMQRRSKVCNKNGTKCVLCGGGVCGAWRKVWIMCEAWGMVVPYKMWWYVCVCV